MNKANRRRRIWVFARLSLGIIRDFYKETRLVKRKGLTKARRRMSKRHRKRASQLRDTAIKMGGVLIKLGQFLSSRVDVMPDEYIEELAKLQDMVPPAPFGQIKSLLEKEFKKPLNKIFKDFEKEPRAAASLAQVHNAVLHDSTPAVVKVQRPGIEELVNIDLATFSYLMDGINRFTSFGKKADISKITEEFARTLGDELDFFREGHNAERFHQNFGGDGRIFIPKVYWNYTTSKVLTLERVDAIKINDYAALEEQGISRSEVAQEVVDSYLKQVLLDGFFHADPHPGNLFVVEGPEITFVDFGMVGEISPAMRENLKEVAMGVATRNIDRMLKALTALGFLRKGANLSPVKRAIGWMIDHYSSLTSNTLSMQDIEQINDDLKKIMRDQPFTIPAEYAFLGRALGTLHGLATGLAPDFNAIEQVKPYINKLIKEEKESLTQVFIKETSEILKALVSLPRRADEIMSAIQKGELAIKVESKDIEKAINRSTKGQRTIALSIFSSILILAAVFLLNFDFRIESYVVFALSLIFISFTFLTSRPPKRRLF